MPYESNKEIAKAIGQRLRQLSARLGLTGKEIAERLGISQSTFSRYTLGSTLPGVDLLIGLFREFKVNPLFVLFGQEPVIVENLQLLSNIEDEVGKKYLSVGNLLENIIDSVGIDEVELYLLMPNVYSEREFMMIVHGDPDAEGKPEVPLKTLRELACKICADFEYMIKHREYEPNLFFLKDLEDPIEGENIERSLKTCSIDEVYVFAPVSGDYVFLWLKHGKYGGSVLALEDVALSDVLESELKKLIGAIVLKPIKVFILRGLPLNHFLTLHPLKVLSKLREEEAIIKWKPLRAINIEEITGDFRDNSLAKYILSKLVETQNS